MERKIVSPARKNCGLRIFVICSLVLVLVSACGGKKEVKEETPDAKISKEAISIAETVRSAYVEKTFSSIQWVSTEDAYKAILNSVKHFDSVELTFTPKWVEIEKTMVYLNVAWNGTWTVGGETTRERGMAIFLFDGQPLKLSKIIRGSPFVYPER